MDSLEDLRRVETTATGTAPRDGNISPTQPPSIRSNSHAALDSAANVALPASESSSLRQLQEHTDPADRIGSMASKPSWQESTQSGGGGSMGPADVALPGSEASSLRHLQEQTAVSRQKNEMAPGPSSSQQPLERTVWGDRASLITSSAIDVALPASVASSLRYLEEQSGVVGAADTMSVQSSLALDVALPVSGTSSLEHLQQHEDRARQLIGTSPRPSVSASNVAIPGSASSSLQALARLHSKRSTEQTGGLREWSFPLPPSRRSSLVSTQTTNSLVPSHTNGIPLDTLNLSSLEQLQNAGASARAGGSQHVHAGNIPLPPSPVGSDSVHTNQNEDPWAGSGRSSHSQRRKKKRAKARARPEPTSYAERIEPLIRCMPHLSSLEWTRKECRNVDAGEVSLVDFYGPLFDHDIRILKELDGPWAVGHKVLQRLPRKSPDGVTSRLIMIDDLSPDIIETLGSIFNIDPEAFALQLGRGRSSKLHPVDDQDERWNTSGMPTSNASIQWYRPVKLGHNVAAWVKDLPSLRRLLGVSFNEMEEDVCYSWFQKQTKHWKREGYGVYGISDTTRFVSQKDIHHRARITTNIFRRSRLLSTNAGEASKESVPTAWEERATIVKVEDASVPTLIFLVDPMPTIVDDQTVTETRLRLNPVPSRVTREPTKVRAEVEVFLPSRIRVPLEMPSNKLDMSEDEMQELRKASEATSTAKAVQSWLATMYDETNPVLALLEVVRLDSIAFFDSLDACLKEISEDSMDDYLMTRRLADWRQLLNDFESKVTEISDSLHDFIDFAFEGPDDRPARVEEIIKELDSRTQGFSRRIEKAYAALRAEMGLFESRRSIAEAETVTKLTELAFVFIPLTFCCGLFSMQVNELQNGVPLRTFIITAIIVFIICYGARIIMRSSIIVESMQSAQESLWAAGKMKPGSQIPTRQLVLLTLKEAWRRGGSASTYLVFLVVLSFTVVPVAFLWTNVRLGSSLNVLIMLLLVPIGIAVAWTCATAYTDVRNENDGTDDEVPPVMRMALWVSEAIFSRRKNTSRSGFSSAFSSPEDSEYSDV